MIDNNFTAFSSWLPNAIGTFLLLMFALTVLGVFFGYLVAAFRHGPSEGFYVVAQTVGGSIPDFLGTSPRRVMAIARLAIKESVRRRVVMVTFAVFAVALLFGGWFMNAGSENPDRIYINFVAFGTQLLVLMMGMLIACFSLPEDIKNKTIYTVVTKPVRASEVVLGRVVGFAVIGTILIALMGLLSFLFVWRGLSHNHQLVGDVQTIASLAEIDPVTRLNRFGKRVSESAIMEGETTFDDGHRHIVELIEDIRDAKSKPLNEDNVISRETLPDGRIRYLRMIVEPTSAHTHNVVVEGEGDDAKLSLGTSKGFFRARVPYYSDKLTFYDNAGNLKDKGYNIGKEIQSKGYIDGGSYMSRSTLSKAVFQFDNMSADLFENDDFYVLEMKLGVFRTSKGDIEKRVIGSLQVESVPNNPDADNKIVSDLVLFETNEYQTQILPLKRKMLGQVLSPDGTVLNKGEFDLFDDFAKNGQVNLVLRCEDQNQYLGTAQSDLYFRVADHPYAWNFFKTYLGIWAQMLVIVSLGVAFSTFLSAPVAVVGTLVMMIVGFSTDFIKGMLSPDSVGGGPVESFYKIITQKSMDMEMEAGVATTLLRQFDLLLVNILSALTNIAPNFAKLNFSKFLVEGYAIDFDHIAIALSTAFALCIGFSIFGYFCLKTREIAK